jgi:hypothetical protein
MQGKLEVVRLFCADPSRELTIRAISQLIKKSYAYTNKEVWELISDKVLKHKEIGKSVICSLDIHNPYSQELLAFNSFSDSKAKQKDEIISELKKNDALFAFYSKSKLHIVCRDKSLFKGMKAETMTKQDFIDSLKKMGLDNSVVYGYEKYWEIVGDAYAQ